MKGELSPEARSIVEAARDADGPSDADRNRVRASVFAAIATGAGVESAEAASSASGANAAAASSGTALKVVGALILAGGLATGGYLLFADRGSDGGGGKEPAVAPSEAAPERERETEPATKPAPEAQPEPAPENETAMQAETKAKVDPPSMEFSPDRLPKKPRREESTLAAERELISRAKRARERGEPAKALRLLDDYARRFRGGLLLEERAAIRILALCDLDRRPTAKRAAERFLDRWPESIYAPRVKGSCAGG